MNDLEKSERSDGASPFVVAFCLLGVVYALAGSLFFLSAEALFSVLNLFPDFLKIIKDTPAQLQQFFGLLLGSYWLTIAVGFFLSALRPRQWGLKLLLFAATLVLGIGAVSLFTQTDEGYTAYLAIGLFQIATAVTVAWFSLFESFRRRRRARRSRPKKTYFKSLAQEPV